MTGRNPIADACEEVMRQNERDNRNRPLNPEHDLRWENFAPDHDDFTNLDYDNGYYD